MKLKVLAVLAATPLFLAGCQTPISLVSKPATTSPAQPVQTQVTFEDILQHTQADPLQGKVLAEMESIFDPALNKFAFNTQNGKLIFVYAESNGSTRLLIVNPDGSVYQQSFPDYILKRAILNNKILYIGFKGDSAIKFNTDSFDFSEVDKAELDRTREVLDEMVLPDKETPVYTHEGYVYTEEGYVFDIKNHEYLNPDEKQKYYEKADFGYGAYLFQLEPRLDQAVNLKTIKIKGDQTKPDNTYGIQLDLPAGYDVKNLSFTVDGNGKLLLFAPGVKEDQSEVIKLFEIPLQSFKE